MSVVFFNHVLTDIGYIVVVLDSGYSIQVFFGKKNKKFYIQWQSETVVSKKKKASLWWR